MKGKKLLAGLLSAAMVLGTMVMPTFADEGSAAEDGVTLVDDSESFLKAIKSTDANTTIRLTNDIRLDYEFRDTYQEANGSKEIQKDCTIDLDRYALDIGKCTYFTTYKNVTFTGVKGYAKCTWNAAKGDGVVSDSMFRLEESGVFTFENITFEGSRKLSWSVINVNSNGGKCYLKNCEYSVGSEQTFGEYFAGFVSTNGADSVIDVTDCNIDMGDSDRKVFQNGKYLISGESTITGKNNNGNTYVLSENVTINGAAAEQTKVLAYDADDKIVGGYPTLENAISNAPAGATLKLMADDSIDESVDLNNSIDLNRHTLNLLDDSEIAIKGVTAPATRNDIVISNGTIKADGVKSKHEGFFYLYVHTPETYKSLELNDVDFICNDFTGESDDIWYIVYLSTRTQFKATNGTTFTVTNGGNLCAVFDDEPGSSSMEFDNTTITVTNAPNTTVMMGKIKVENSKLYLTNVKRGFVASENQITLSNTKAEIDGCENAVRVYDDCAVSLENNTKISVKNATGPSVWFDDEETGGATYTVDETSSINGETNAVAKIGDVYYTSFADAYTAAEDNATITLLKDIVVSPHTWFDDPITIDLNNHTFKVDPTINWCMYVTKDVTFKNGIVDISDVNVTHAVWGVDNGTTNEKVTMTFDKVTLYGSNVVQTAAAVFLGQRTYPAEIIFNDCTVDLTATELNALSGRFINEVDVTFNNTNADIHKFIGVIASSEATLNGTSTINTDGGEYAVNNSKLTMNDNAKLTAKGCTEAGIKLGIGSFIDLNDTSSLELISCEKDVIFRDEVNTDELKQAVKIDVEPNATLDADLSEVAEQATVEGKANAVSVVFEETEDDENVYNIVLSAHASSYIHEFASAQLKFAKGNDEIGYTVEGANDLIHVIPQGNDVYLFSLKDGAEIIGDENNIVIGKVIFDGYSENPVNFSVAEYENKVEATKGQNIVETFTEENGKLYVNVEPNGTIGKVFEQPKCDITINVAMNQKVEDNVADYQQMKVVISGQDLPEPIEYVLGSGEGENEIKQENKVYSITERLPQMNTYVITVTGDGYRKAEYILKVKEDETKTVNFWNNVQLVGSKLEMEEDNDASAAWYNFIAGDIVKDNRVNLYDLSAVVAYFGESHATDSAWDKVKYDLNRDGIIDSTDVAIVLEAWKGLNRIESAAEAD